VTVPPGQGQPAPDLGIAAPGVVDRGMPYMRTYLEAVPGSAAMTGVTADATLEVPTRAVGVPWRALFAGFPVEAVLPLPNHHDRAQLLRAVFDWSMEPEDVTVTVTGPVRVRMGRAGTFTATASSPSGVRVVGWRWDPGDGRPFVTTAGPALTLTYGQPGVRTVRAEALTAHGHTWVAEHLVRVESGGLFLPWAVKQRR
jgi:hypothetical protein